MYLDAGYLERHFYRKECKETREVMPRRDNNCPAVVHSNSSTVYNLAETKNKFKILANYNPITFKANTEF